MKYISLDQISAKADALIGKDIYTIVGGEEDLSKLKSGKGNVGNLIERYGFGIPNNSFREPDFMPVGIELKVLPLKSVKSKFTPKERTKICSINYKELAEELWAKSHCKDKLNKIFFVAYIHDFEDCYASEVMDCFLYDLENRYNDHRVIKADWNRIKDMIVDGLAHEISESHSDCLAASTSGSGRLLGQPFSSEKAKERSFSLKPSYTKVIWQERKQKKNYDSLFDLPDFVEGQDVRSYLLGRLHQFEGMSIVELSSMLGVSLKSGKSASSFFLRRVLGFKTKKLDVRELALLGINIRVVPVNPKTQNLRESVSFPHQTLQNILDETCFEESQLFNYLSEILFVPVYRGASSKDSNAKLGRACFWTPSTEELRGISDEWERARDYISQLKVWKSNCGKYNENNLLKSSDSNFIHMRPHAKNSLDTEKSVGVVITKQSFWLNSKFVSTIIKNP
jgi:DNA mismatch repair protein MutH